MRLDKTQKYYAVVHKDSSGKHHIMRAFGTEEEAVSDATKWNIFNNTDEYFVHVVYKKVEERV